MTPFFIIGPPRNKGSLLMRMLDASPGVRCAGESSAMLAKLRELERVEAGQARKAAAESWPMHRHHAVPQRWHGGIGRLLQEWVNPEEAGSAYGCRVTFLGREGWESAVDWWSWLLDTWEDARLIFLGRDQAEIELSMMMTRSLWRPAYGTCAGHCGGRVHHHLRSMADFHAMNPAVTALLDAADLGDYDKLAGEFGRIGIPLDRAAWEQELGSVLGRWRDLQEELAAGPAPQEPEEHPAFREDATLQEVVESTAALLWVAAVGRESTAWRETAARFQVAGARIWLMVYDDSDPDFPADKIIRGQGGKFQLAELFLRPPEVEEFDYLFLWDDDVLAGEDFDPRRFAGLMATHGLAAAQPAVLGPVNHGITRPQPDEGRETSFVEIMCPVYSREGWKALYPYLDAGNASGWGYDHAPIGKRGIIDSMPVTHTRPGRSDTPAARAELKRFLDRHGLDERIETIRPLGPPVPLAGADLEVYTLRYGKPPWLPPCAASLELWCKRHGYQLKVRGPDPDLPDEKFATLGMIREFLKGPAKRMLFVDADVLVHPAAPAWPGSDGFQVRPDPGDKVLADWRAWAEERNPKLLESAWRYANSGVWACDRDSAAAFLAAAEKTAPAAGYREQHQFNAWWGEAAAAGMKHGELPAAWNLLIDMEAGEGWFFHLAGKKKLPLLADAQSRAAGRQPLEAWKADPFGDRAEREALETWKPAKPWPFSPRQPEHERAIVCPWLSSAAAWGEEELRYALRSWEAFFTDRECPIYLLADRKPRWLAEGGRVRFLPMDYSRGAERGLRQAFATGLQLADNVIWTNDDFALLRSTGWEDLKIALRRGSLEPVAARFLASRNAWLRTLGTVCRDLQKAGVARVWNFATHTPFLFEREKAVEVLRRFHLRFRGSFETLYFNWHRTPHRPCGNLKVHALPAPPEARFLNWSDRTLTPELKAGLRSLFPAPAPWEAGIPKVIHQTWATAEIPHGVYPGSWIQSWRELHPGWEYRFWTDADLIELADAHYPAFSDLLRAARGVVKADVGRLLVLHRHGGLYADLDYVALRPMDDLVAGGDCFVCTAADGYTHNALLAAAAGNEFILAAAKAALSRWKEAPHMSPEWIAGPGLLTELAAKWRPQSWDPALVCPLDWRSGRTLTEESDLAGQFPGAHAVTLWRHNW